MLAKLVIISLVMIPSLLLAPLNAVTALQITVSKFYTDGELNPLPTHLGAPSVDVTLSGGRVRSTNPGQILAWVQIANTGAEAFRSVVLNETLPVDWSVHPTWMPSIGAIHVFFQFSNGTRVEITQPATIKVSTGNPLTVALSIPDLTATAANKNLGPGESILISISLKYALIGTTQSAVSYPRNYTDIASALAAQGASLAGPSSSGHASTSFVPFAKVVGYPTNPPSTLFSS